ncbi:hypothetical protein B0H10DRAFT_2059581 [Mycena sp. CBHHK59/15]|nr:hypothetical protein B0H10DRAFT_2059581 [Mycena sp. CBHHK59/15]
MYQPPQTMVETVVELRRVSARRTLLPSHRVPPSSPSIPSRMFPSSLPWPAYYWLYRWAVSASPCTLLSRLWLARRRSSLVPTIRYTQCIRVSPRPAAAGCSASCAVSVRRPRRGHLCRTWFRYLAVAGGMSSSSRSTTLPRPPSHPAHLPDHMLRRTRTGPSAPARTGSSATRGPAAAPASGLAAPCWRNGVPPHAHRLLVREWALRGARALWRRARPSSAQVRCDV